MGRPEDKVAVIAGASSGIGPRAAEIFGADGAKIVIAGRRVPEGETLAERVGTNYIFRKLTSRSRSRSRRLALPQVLSSPEFAQVVGFARLGGGSDGRLARSLRHSAAPDPGADGR